jgi:hypothetical protein
MQSTLKVFESRTKFYNFLKSSILGISSVISKAGNVLYVLILWESYDSGCPKFPVFLIEYITYTNWVYLSRLHGSLCSLTSYFISFFIENYDS